MRIILHSNSPEQNTGYGIQCRLLALGLRDLGHDVAVSVFTGFNGRPQSWNGLPLLPSSGEPFGLDVLPGHYRQFNADLVITLMDVWVLNPQLLAASNMTMACWTPVDCEPLGSVDRECLQITGAKPIAMSRFGERMIRNEGLDPAYVPHAIDTNLYAPPADRDALRKAMGVEGRFVVGMNAANQDKVRKGFAEAFQAFAKFRERHPEALLMVNTCWRNERAQHGDGLDLEPLAERCGLAGHVVYPDQYDYRGGLISDEAIARFYGTLDVLLNPSHGEGFGLPVLESQSCGTPVIVTDASAMPELCGAGWRVEGQRHWAWLHEAWWVCPSVPGLVRALEKAHEHAGRKRAQAREFALKFDHKRVLQEYWVPVLAELEASI